MKCSLTLPNIPWGTKRPPVKNHGSKQMREIYFNPLSPRGDAPSKSLASCNKSSSCLFFSADCNHLFQTLRPTSYGFSPADHFVFFPFLLQEMFILILRCLLTFFFLVFLLLSYVLFLIVWRREVTSMSELIELSLLEVFTIIFIG